MAIRKISRMGHPVLRVRSEEIEDPTSPEIHALVADMMETLVDAGGIGLAAPQVYEAVRLMIFHPPADIEPADSEPEDPDDFVNPDEDAADEAVQPRSRQDIIDQPLTILINPEIEYLSDDKEMGWEGCLSIPGLRGMVPRYTHIRYRGLGIGGEKIEVEARDLHARIFQHEFDHLDGILYPERMTDLGDLIFESEA